jgi:hypothetical protein
MAPVQDNIASGKEVDTRELWETPVFKKSLVKEETLNNTTTTGADGGGFAS